MIKLSIYINSAYRQLDVDSSTDITYKYQVRRFADMADTPIQYSYNIQLPTTDLNCALFQEVYHSDFQNGIFNAWVGTKCIVNDGYSDVIRGMLILESASKDSINVRIIDEMNDFFQYINSILLRSLQIPYSGSYSDGNKRSELDHVINNTALSNSWNGTGITSVLGTNIGANFRYIMAYHGPYQNFDNAKKYTNSQREDFEDGQAFSATGKDIIDVDWRYRPDGYKKDIIYDADNLSEHERTDRRWSNKDGSEAFDYYGEYRSYKQLPAIRAMYLFDRLSSYVTSNSNFSIVLHHSSWQYLQDLWIVFPGYSLSEPNTVDGTSVPLLWPSTDGKGRPDYIKYQSTGGYLEQKASSHNEGLDVTDINHVIQIGGNTSYTSPITGNCRIFLALNYLVDCIILGGSSSFTLWKGPATWIQVLYRINGGTLQSVPCNITGNDSSTGLTNDWLCLCDDSRLQAASNNPNPTGLNRKDYYIESIDPRANSGKEFLVTWRNLRNNEVFNDGIISFAKSVDVAQGDVLELFLHWKGSPHWFTNSAPSGILNLNTGKVTIGATTTLRILSTSNVTFSDSRTVQSGSTIRWYNGILNDFISSSSITCYTFLTELCKLFNWYWWKEQGSSKVEIHIGDSSQFYNGNNKIDLNKSVDISTPVVYTPFIPDARYQVLKYTDLDSIFEKEYQSKFGQAYGSFVLDTNYPYSIDSKDLVVSKFNNWVLGTLYNYYYQYRNSTLNKDNKIIPVLEDSSGTGIDFEWFICYMKGQRSVDKRFIITDDNPPFDANMTICWNDHQDSGYIQQVNYPAIYKSLIDVSSPISLHFGIPQVNYESSSIQESNSLYELFWQKYLSDYFDENARTAEVSIKNSDILLENTSDRNWFRGFIYYDQGIYILESLDYSFNSEYSKAVIRRIKSISDYTTSSLPGYTPPNSTHLSVTVSASNIVQIVSNSAYAPTNNWYAELSIEVVSDLSSVTLYLNLPLQRNGSYLRTTTSINAQADLVGNLITSRSATLKVYCPSGLINGSSSMFYAAATTTGVTQFSYNWSYAVFTFPNVSMNNSQGVSVTANINYIYDVVVAGFSLTNSLPTLNYIGDISTITPSVNQEYSISWLPTGFEEYVTVEVDYYRVVTVTCIAVPTDADFTGTITYVNTAGETHSTDVVIKKNWVSSVTLTEHSLTLSKSTAHQLAWTVLPTNAPNKTVYFISSNPNVVGVDRETGYINTFQLAGTASVLCWAEATLNDPSPVYDIVNITVQDYGTYLVVDPKTFDYGTQVGYGQVTYAGHWTLETSADFVYGFNVYSGTGTTSISFNINSNYGQLGTLDRTASIILRDYDTKQIIDIDTVHQAGIDTGTNMVYLGSISRVAGSPGDTFSIYVMVSGSCYWNASLMGNVSAYFSMSGGTGSTSSGTITISSSSTQYDSLFGCVVVIRWGKSDTQLTYTITVPINVFRE